MAALSRAGHKPDALDLMLSARAAIIQRKILAALMASATIVLAAATLMAAL